MTKRRTHTTIATAALSFAIAGSLALPATPSFADGFTASEATEAALADAQARYAAAMAYIGQLNDAYFEAEARYDEISNQLAATQQAIYELQLSIEQKQAELAVAQDVLADRLAASYRAGTTDLLDVVLASTDFSDFLTRVYYANKVASSDADAIAVVKQIKASLEADQAALIEQEALEQQLLFEQAQQLEELNYQLFLAQDYAASLDDEVRGLMAQRDAEIAAAAEAARIAAAQQAAVQAAEAAAQAAAEAAAAQGQDPEAAYQEAYQEQQQIQEEQGIDVPEPSYSGGGPSMPGVVGVACECVGRTYYLYGGSDPYGGIDCSGTTQYAYGCLGVYLPHQSAQQYGIVCSLGNLVGAGGLQPGDLVFYAPNGVVNHVGIYMGDGMVVQSLPEAGVCIRSLYYCSGFCGGGSPI